MADGAETPGEDRRSKVLAEYRKTLLQQRRWTPKSDQVRCICSRALTCRLVNALPCAPLVREEAKTLKKQYDKTEDDLKALQSVGQIIGEVLRRLDEERCALASQPRSPVRRATTRLPPTRASL